jgi:hypothetical protein
MLANATFSAICGDSENVEEESKEPATVYYSREFGNDETGNGTPRHPYRTYAGAAFHQPLISDGPPAVIRNLDK